MIGNLDILKSGGDAVIYVWQPGDATRYEIEFTVYGPKSATVAWTDETLQSIVAAFTERIDKLEAAITDLDIATQKADKRVEVLRQTNRELAYDLAKITNAVAEGGWCSGETTSDPEHLGPTADDAVATIREFYRFREAVWNDDAERDELRTVYVLHSGYAEMVDHRRGGRPSGAWRGWEKCRGATDSVDATLVFDTAEAAEAHRNRDPETARFWWVWPIQITEPNVGDALLNTTVGTADDGAS